MAAGINVEVIADPKRKQAVFVVTYPHGNKEHFVLTYDEGRLIVNAIYLKADGRPDEFTHLGLQPVDRNSIALYLT